MTRIWLTEPVSWRDLQRYHPEVWEYTKKNLCLKGRHYKTSSLRSEMRDSEEYPEDQCLLNNKSVFAMVDGKPVGWATWEPWRKGVQVYVTRPWRRKGVGTLLVGRFIKRKGWELSPWSTTAEGFLESLRDSQR